MCKSVDLSLHTEIRYYRGLRPVQVWESDLKVGDGKA